MRVLTVADLTDQVHPNDAGYRKMADVWFPAIQDLL
jgi:lysophospholipase L1-like esterase